VPVKEHPDVSSFNHFYCPISMEIPMNFPLKNTRKAARFPTKFPNQKESKLQEKSLQFIQKRK
jgi:hypothetical protein